MTVFAMIWTCFVFYQFRNDEMFKKGGFGKVYQNTKKLALENDKKEFDHAEMKEDQLKMYVLLQIAILCFEIIIPLSSVILASLDSLEDKHGLYKDKCVLKEVN